MLTKQINTERNAHFDLSSPQKCLGLRIHNARVRCKKSQKWLAEQVHKSRVIIANYENGKASPEPEIAVLIAKALGENPTEYLLLSNVQRVFSQNREAKNEVLDIVEKLMSGIEESTIQYENSNGLTTHLSLMDFPHRFPPGKFVVFVGDKREEEPQNTGDLFVFSASTVDDRWLASLSLPPDTEKISDKVIMTADEQWLKKRFGDKHILCIGSPASNIYARKYNHCFLSRFAIMREAQEKWEKTLVEMKKLSTLGALLNFYEDSKADLKQKMRLFKPPGFIDFNYKHLRLGMDLSYGKDFAVVSLGRNPFAEPDAPYFSVLAAGVHHPGTAHAVKFLSESSKFKEHPFGGIIEVEVPSKEVEPKDVFWYNKIEQCASDWHKVGGDELKYTPEELIAKLNEWLGKFNDIVTDVDLKKEEIEKHIELISLLASTKETGG